jgi:tyrosyl-tRNA synthetase
LVGTDGVQKMSQSLGNYVSIAEPPDQMFGKLTRVPDPLIPEYRRLTLDFFTDPAEADRVGAGLEDGSLEPWEEKRRLAREIVDLYHGPGSGSAAEERFLRATSDRTAADAEPMAIPHAAVTDGRVWLPRLLKELGIAPSTSEARRLIASGGVRLDGAPLEEPDREYVIEDLLGKILQVGRRRWRNGVLLGPMEQRPRRGR